MFAETIKLLERFWDVPMSLSSTDLNLITSHFLFLFFSFFVCLFEFKCLFKKSTKLGFSNTSTFTLDIYTYTLNVKAAYYDPY